MPSYYPRCRVLIRALFETFDGGEGAVVETFDVIPRDVTIERNTAREADTFSLELDYKDFPFDPRAVRSILVAVHMGQREDGDPLKRLGLTRETGSFVGYVDEPRTTLTATGEIVSFSGRDYTGIFLDYTWPDGEPIDITRPLELVLSGILQAVPGAEELAFEFSAGAATGARSILSKVVGRTKWTPRGDKDDAWTVITDLVGSIGLIAVVELDRLIIKAPAEFGDQQPAFVYGRNVERLEFIRKLNEVRTEQIRVTCWDEQAGELREATYPQKAVVVRKRIAPKSGKATPVLAPIRTFSVSGSFGEDDLLKVARRIYEDGAREQFEGTLETKDLLDLEGTYALTRLGNGDQLTVKLGNDSRASIVGLPVSEGARILTEGPDRVDPRVALALARSIKRADQLQSKFYVKTARHTWGREKGYGLVTTFINYVGAGHG